MGGVVSVFLVRIGGLGKSNIGSGYGFQGEAAFARWGGQDSES